MVAIGNTKGRIREVEEMVKMKIEVRLFDELVETFDLERPDEVVRLVEYMNYHSRNRRYRLAGVVKAPSSLPGAFASSRLHQEG